MDKPVLYLISAFFILGGVDYILGNPLRLGNKFKEGFQAMGTLALGMIGIYSISPVFRLLLTPVTATLSPILHIDPSILPACIFPVDMGGYTISKSMAQSALLGRFSGVVIGSALGTAVSFSIPIACGFIKKEDRDFFAKGIVIGIISLVPGCFFAGLLCGIGPIELTVNMIPLFITVALLSAGLVFFPSRTLKAFHRFGTFITALGVLGILLQGLDVILNIRLLPDMVPFKDTVFLVGKITLILAGAYPMMELLSRVLGRHFEKIGRVLGVNAESIAALLGNLASNLLVFGMMGRLNDRGKVLCTALAVSMAFAFGGQFAYVASVEPGMTAPFFLSKFVSGAVGIFLVLYLPARQAKVKNRLQKIN